MHQTAFDDLLKSCEYFYETLNPDEYLSINLSIHNITLNTHIYRLKNNVTVKSTKQVNNIFKLCTTNDCATQIILCQNLTINSSITFKPPYRCKGMVIFANKIINNGTISMYGRGCSATGQNIYLYQNEYVPAVGGAGAVRSITNTLYNNGGNYLNGNAGTNGAGRQTGGGGSGAVRNYVARMYPGSGGAGTSYSGGAGGGAAVTDRADSRTAGDGSSTGGQGGHGAQGGNTTGNSGGDTNGYGQVAGGGQGNGPGNNVWSNANAYVPTQDTGTGGLLIIYCNELDNKNNINANGVKARYTVVNNWSGWQGYGAQASGGSSGGGSVNIFYNTKTSTGTVTATGGEQQWSYASWAGGRGGNGTVTYTKIEEISKIIPPIPSTRQNSDIYKNNDEKDILDLNSNLLELLQGE